MGLFSSDQNKQEPSMNEDDGHFTKADDDAVAAVARSKRASNAGEGAGRRGRNNDASDQLLPEKKRARRRLVGAIALALGVAIGLPMILDSGPRPLARDIAIQIPSKDKAPALPVPAPAPAETLDPKEEIVTPVEPAPAPAPVTANKTDVAAVAPKAEAPKAEAAKPEAAKPEAAKPEAPKPEPKKPVPADKPAAKPVADEARALAILEDKEVAAPRTFPVGAFASPDKVNELTAKLKAAGLKVQTSKAGKNNELTRVTVGPYTTKEEADKAQAKLAQLKL
jgi:DedD protein